MNTFQIRRDVRFEIKKWSNLQKGDGNDIIISDGAINLICYIIKNFQEDGKRYFRHPSNRSENDKIIIYITKKIPDLLSRILQNPEYKDPTSNKFEIDSVILLLEMSKILPLLCPVPELDPKIMRIIGELR